MIPQCLSDLTAEERVERIRVILMREHPFYGRIACSIGWHTTNDPAIPTVGTNGLSVIWNGDFVKTLSDPDMKFIAVHEIHHIIKRHPWRRGERDPILWNIACDYSINAELIDWSVGDMPSDGLLDRKYDGMLEEHIYDKILVDNNFDLASGGGAVSTGYFEDSPQGTDLAEVERKLDKMIEAAYKAALDAGKVPGFLQDFVYQNRQSQVNWRARLRMQVEPLFPKDVTWATPNRRLIHMGIYAPGTKKDGAPEVAVLIDTSGSVSHDQINAFLSEINAIISSVSPQRTQVHWFESHVWKTEMLGTGQLLAVPDEIQQGGTNFEKAFAAVKGNPRVIICLTDMYDSFEFKPPRGSTVIWVATTDVEAPWGITIPIKI